MIAQVECVWIKKNGSCVHIFRKGVLVFFPLPLFLSCTAERLRKLRGSERRIVYDVHVIYNESNSNMYRCADLCCNCHHTARAHSLPPRHPFPFIHLFTFSFPGSNWFHAESACNTKTHTHTHTIVKLFAGVKYMYTQIYTNLKTELYLKWEKKHESKRERARTILYVTLYISILFSPIMNHGTFFVYWHFSCKRKMAKVITKKAVAAAMWIRDRKQKVDKLSTKKEVFSMWCFAYQHPVRLCLCHLTKCYIT